MNIFKTFFTTYFFVFIFFTLGSKGYSKLFELKKIKKHVDECTSAVEHYKWNSFSFITAEIEGVFKEEVELKERITEQAKILHNRGWKHDEDDAQLIVYRATILEKILNKIYPPTNDAYKEIHNDINNCLGFEWAKGTKWYQQIKENKKILNQKKCHDLSLFIRMRQRIKIAEEKHLSTAKAFLDDPIAPWVSRLGQNILWKAPQSIMLLDLMIYTIVANWINNPFLEKSEQIPEINKLLTTKNKDLVKTMHSIIRYLTEKESSSSFQMCGGSWPQKEDFVSLTEKERTRLEIRTFYHLKKMEIDLLKKNKKTDTDWKGQIKFIDITPQQAKKELDKIELDYLQDLLASTKEGIDPIAYLKKEDSKDKEIIDYIEKLRKRMKNKKRRNRRKQQK